MTDREMMEFAAKAAGYDVRVVSGYERGGTATFYMEPDGFPWRPREDDGDALRLAVALGKKYPCFVVGIFHHQAVPHTSASVVHRDGAETYVQQDIGEDVSAATRLAIFRAAVEIGRKLAEEGQKP